MTLVPSWFRYSTPMSSLLDPDREVFPNAPLKLVACEVSYQLAPGADLDAAKQPFYDEMEDRYPLPGHPPHLELRMDAGPNGPVQQVTAQGFRFLSRDKTRSIVAAPQALVVETSAYTRFEAFSATVAEAVEVLGRHLRIAVVERIGLRYIDEVPLASLPGDTFDGYFSDAALAATAQVEGIGRPEESLTTVSYALGADCRVILRTGSVRQPVVTTNGPLLIKEASTAPLFIIDVDSAWQATTTTPLAFDPLAVSDMIAQLHRPVRTLFNHTITEKLRDDVLRKEKPPA